VIVVCRIHGATLIPNMIGGTGSVTFTNSNASCPICGSMSRIMDGTYSSVDGIVRAFESSSREKIERFRELIVLQDSKNTEIKEIEQEIVKLGTGFESLWHWLQENTGAISFILSIISIVLMIYFEGSSDNDAKVLQQTIENQTKVQTMILSEMQKDKSSIEDKELQHRPKMRIQQSNQDTSLGPSDGPNRHERRKASSLSRRRSAK
jgi:hypothetical protein